MQYLYHWIPKGMRGDVLFPLNALKNIYPDLYELKAQKYVGREQIMLEKLPSLDCLWNDVLHLSAVHPSLLRQAYEEAGGMGVFDLDVFEIDPHLLDPKDTIVYLYKHTDIRGNFLPENFAAYDPDGLDQYSVVPQETKDYYKEMISHGKEPMLFHRVPHILYKGSINISGLKRVQNRPSSK